MDIILITSIIATIVFLLIALYFFFTKEVEKTVTGVVVTVATVGTILLFASGPPGENGIISGSSTSPIGGLNYSDLYAEMVDAFYASGNVTQDINGKLWVPWMDSSTQCTVNNLQDGSNCNSGETIDFNNNCMVTDEFSQVGVLVSLDTNATRMHSFYSMSVEIASDNGQLPAWRVYRDGTTVEPCRPNVNSNCDTATDASGRIITAHHNAANNSAFSSGNRTLYAEYALNLTRDSIEFEYDYRCENVSLAWANGTTQNCWWMKTGSEAFLTGTDGWYPGYIGDMMIAFAQSFARSGNQTHLSVVNGSWISYLQAAYPSGYNISTHGFRVPPGRSGKWTFTSGMAVYSCTNTCSPAQWDGADAPRAVKICMASYYLQKMNVSLPQLNEYCESWINEKVGLGTGSFAYQYYPNGTNSSSPQSGYLAQGWESQLVMHRDDTTLFDTVLDRCLDNYGLSTRTFDSTACMGVYNGAFCVHALAAGMGYDLDTFTVVADLPESPDIVFSDAVLNVTNISGGDNVLFNVTITPNNSIDFAYVEIQYPNGTRQNITLTQITIETEGSTSAQWVVNDTDTFASGSESWQGGTRDANTQTYNSSGDFGRIYKNFSRTSDGIDYVNFSFDFTYSDDSNDPNVRVHDDTGDDYLLFDGTKPNINWKHIDDGGGFGECNADISGTVTWADGDTVTLLVNESSGFWATYHNGQKCREETSTLTANDEFHILVQAAHPMSIDNFVYSRYESVVGENTTSNTTMWYAVINDTSQIGYYNVTRLWANKTDGTSYGEAQSLSFLVSFPPGNFTTASLCSGVSSIKFDANQSLVVGGLTNQSRMVTNVDECVLYLNTTGEVESSSLWAKLNQTNSSYVVEFGGVNLTTSYQFVDTLSPNTISRYNATGYWINAPINFFAFKLQLRVNDSG